VLSIVFLEITNFKSFRKSLGNDLNSYLHSLAAELKNNLRAGDIISRYSETTFLILLHDATEPDAKLVGERLMQTIGNVTSKGRSIAETKIGIATHGLDIDFDNVDEWIDHANKNLRSKSADL
jgi:diguanylate cyclase (GGDEF)-like protein